MANKLRAQIETLTRENEEQKLKITNLEAQIGGIEERHRLDISNLESVKKNEFDSLANEHKEEIDKKEAEVTQLKQENREKQAQIDKRELKKLAEAYSEQEDAYVIESRNWLKALAIAAGLLLTSALVSILVTNNLSWIESIRYYVVDFVLISAVWFCSSHYSDSVKLRYDYANRKTLAQSFSNILNNLTEDVNIKNKFIEKTTEVLCAPSIAGDREPILSKKVIKDLAEIVGAATGK